MGWFYAKIIVTKDCCGYFCSNKQFMNKTKLIEPWKNLGFVFFPYEENVTLHWNLPAYCLWWIPLADLRKIFMSSLIISKLKG